MSETAAAAAAKAGDGKVPDDAAKAEKPEAKAAPATAPETIATDKPAKTEKTFSKSEADAIAKKAVEDAQKKWESEKDLSELERLKKENDDLRAANRLRDAKDEVVTALTAAGNRSPELAFKAIQGDLKFDEKTGKLLNAKDLIESFKAAYPEQFGTEKPDGSIDGGAGQGQRGSKLTREAIEKMTPAEINQNWDEVQKVLSGK